MKKHTIEIVFMIVWAILMAIALSACSKPAGPRCQHLLFISATPASRDTTDLGMVCGRDLDSCRAHWVTVVRCEGWYDSMYYIAKTD